LLAHRARELTSFPATIRPVVDAASDARVRVAPDEAVLALHCLLENAVDALAGADGCIQLRVLVRDQQVAVEVEDDAAGGLHERALEPFFTTRVGRMGIGLNIAKRIAARWNGRLTLSAVDRGTRATLTFAMEN
jgi:C4-dicarboxylate-specific signal transduction histidine kinase